MEASQRSEDELLEPYRRICGQCSKPVLIVPILTVSRRNAKGARWLTVEIDEWEPRAACQSCARTRAAHPERAVISCARCGNTGYVGRARPSRAMIAIDMGWSDDEGGVVHVRIIGPGTDRRKGEALHEPHHCGIGAL